ncbi:MAG: hypothetical protein ACOX7C_00100 [Brevefilum sp.]|jgi:hypothetical protein
MSKKTISLILIIGGGLFALLSLIADFIGIGSYPGINWAQITGMALGLAVLIFGLWFRTARIKKDE